MRTSRRPVESKSWFGRGATHATAATLAVGAGAVANADLVSWEFEWGITAIAEDPWHVDQQLGGEGPIAGDPDASYVGFQSIGAVVFGEPEEPEWNRHASAEFWAFLAPGAAAGEWSGDVAFGAHGFGVGEGVARATGAFSLTLVLDAPTSVALTGYVDGGSIALGERAAWADETFADELLLEAGVHRIEGLAGFEDATGDDVFASFGLTIAIPVPGAALVPVLLGCVRARRRA